MRPELSDYAHLAGGKVREIYEVDDNTLLMVASDRISAFDFSLEPAIPDKGRILTATSMFFFDLLGDVPNHLAGPIDDERIPEEVLGRAMVVKKLDMVPFECVANKVGSDLAERLRAATLDVYTRAAEYAETKGIILADTKFEFGLDENGELVLADEVLTPDSSRYWPADSYEEGATQPSFDKQYVRNWLTSPKSGWDPADGVQPPELPGSVVEATRDRYIEAYERLSGRRFSEWPGEHA